MPIYLVYPIYTGLLALIVIFVVPKKAIRELSIFGIFLGAVFDIGAILLFVKLLKIATWINYGPFGFWGIPFFPPVAWTCFFILYFYLIPKYKPWNYIFAIVASGYSILFGIILENLGVLTWNYNNFISASCLYPPWLITVTWVYFRITGYSKVSNNKNNLFGLSPIPAKRLNKTRVTHLQGEDMRESEITKPEVIILKMEEKRASFWNRIAKRLR